jgi:hypothetical protein
VSRYALSQRPRRRNANAAMQYEKLQGMIQRQAQVDEVRWSRLQTELASSQNLTVMIFTTFTVIFLPLSFFTSLFGMNTREWGDPDKFVSLRLIGAISRESFPTCPPTYLIHTSHCLAPPFPFFVFAL